MVEPDRRMHNEDCSAAGVVDKKKKQIGRAEQFERILGRVSTNSLITGLGGKVDDSLLELPTIQSRNDDTTENGL